jgi:uncharacterized protein Usg
MNCLNNTIEAEPILNILVGIGRSPGGRPGWRIWRACMAMNDARLQLEGFSLTTAEILYRLPDYPALLQTYVWQEYDLHPRFPRLTGFLAFWTANLEGELYRITVAHKGLISPREVRIATDQLHLH